MMVEADTGIDGEPRQQVLAEIHVAGNLVTVRTSALLVGSVEHVARLL